MATVEMQVHEHGLDSTHLATDSWKEDGEEHHFWAEQFTVLSIKKIEGRMKKSC